MARKTTRDPVKWPEPPPATATPPAPLVWFAAFFAMEVASFWRVFLTTCSLPGIAIAQATPLASTEATRAAQPLPKVFQIFRPCMKLRRLAQKRLTVSTSDPPTEALSHPFALPGPLFTDASNVTRSAPDASPSPFTGFQKSSR